MQLLSHASSLAAPNLQSEGGSEAKVLTPEILL
jgi:hypothetical protein